MKMHQGDEALDRAIFALPLEEPPEGLRASILLATAYRPAPAFSVVELAVLAALGAVAVWLIVLLVLGGGSLFFHTLATIGMAGSRALSNSATLAWLAAGGATALWLSLFTGSQPLVSASHRSGRRTSR
jgi:cell division septal protein FtsQ